MLYLLLVYASEDAAPERGSPEEALMWAEYGTYAASAVAQGILVDGRAVLPSSTATTVRVREGETLTSDGPHASGAEQIGGWYVVDVDNLDDAIEAAAKVPGARHGAVEVRPILTAGRSTRLER
jgi:hypothetical protein